MLSSAGRVGQPHVVHVRMPRLAVALVMVSTMSLTLSACGLIGGKGKEQTPVVIPTVDGEDSAPPATGTSPVGGAPPAPPATDAAGAAPAPETVHNTVTRTGVVVTEKTRNRTATRSVTAVRTQQVNVTSTVTQPAITVTLIATSTVTRTTAGPGATVTRPCLVPPCL